MSARLTELSDLSPEQRAVVETWGQGMAVMAGAGSGKTTTLTVKCTELVRRDPEARFAAVSFTERSASDLRAKLTQRLSAIQARQAQSGAAPPASGALARHWVMTIHGLCATIIREYPREAGFEGEETMLSEPEAALLWERATEAVWLDDDLPPETRAAVDSLLERESRDALLGLLARVRELDSFGALGFLEASDDPSSRALATVARFALDRYARLKRRRGALDFNDLERGADRALESPAVREALQKRFDLVLVDEFQDTNPLQARIIWRFVRPDASNLCVVGDPKQSIYRFRDADVTVFEEFCRRLPVNKQLSWNFRSRPGIIDYTNELCARAFARSPDGIPMRYDPLVPKREPSPDFDPVARLDVSRERGPAELAAWVRSEVGRGVPLHDMALLLRRIRGNERWLKALTSAGVPIAVGSGGLFWSDPRVRELVSFLKWWANPGNTLSGAVFLRAPWMQMTSQMAQPDSPSSATRIDDSVLDAWVKQDPTWQAPFFASGHPVARALEPFRHRVARPGELLMALLSPGSGDVESPESEVCRDAIEAELGAPLLGLWHRVEELSSRGLDLQAAVAEIALSMEQARRERDVPPPRNQGQLSVLTLHGSKGLEFRHVILIDLGKKGRASDAPLLFWDREKGAYLCGRDGEGERDKKNPVEIAWRESERAKSLAESKRVFYVALTRAQERLVLVCPDLEPGSAQGRGKAAAAGSDGERDPDDAFAQDDWRAWVDRAGTDVPRLALPGGPPVSSPASAPEDATGSAPPARPRRCIAPSVLKLQRPRHSVTEWTLLSRCERAYEWTYIRPRPVAEGIEELGLFTGARVPTLQEDEMTQRELGTRVHACLERGDFDGLQALEREVGPERFVAEPVISWAMSSLWMAPPRPPAGRDVWTELAFEIPVPTDGGVPEVLVGSIDRLVVDRSTGQARFSIIDFKITEKPKSVESLLESYQMQMELYAMGLRALEPELAPGGGASLEALLVNISSRTIQALPVPLGQLKPASLPVGAAEIVAGREGRAQVGPLCRHCDFRSRCKEGRKYVEGLRRGG